MIEDARRLVGLSLQLGDVTALLLELSSDCLARRSGRISGVDRTSGALVDALDKGLLDAFQDDLPQRPELVLN